MNFICQIFLWFCPYSALCIQQKRIYTINVMIAGGRSVELTSQIQVFADYIIPISVKWTGEGVVWTNILHNSSGADFLCEINCIQTCGVQKFNLFFVQHNTIYFRSVILLTVVMSALWSRNTVCTRWYVIGGLIVLP